MKALLDRRDGGAVEPAPSIVQDPLEVPDGAVVTRVREVRGRRGPDGRTERRKDGRSSRVRTAGRRSRWQHGHCRRRGSRRTPLPQREPCTAGAEHGRGDGRGEELGQREAADGRNGGTAEGDGGLT